MASFLQHDYIGGFTPWLSKPEASIEVEASQKVPETGR
jgi:hypothetical protein